MSDYTNDRWHVDGLTVTHEDFPGMKWDLALMDNAEGHASQPPNSAWTHAARAWLAAQPKPVPDEPLGLGAVVEVAGKHYVFAPWFFGDDCPWTCYGDDDAFSWTNVVKRGPVTVLSEGVTP